MIYRPLILKKLAVKISNSQGWKSLSVFSSPIKIKVEEAESDGREEGRGPMSNDISELINSLSVSPGKQYFLADGICTLLPRSEAET